MIEIEAIAYVARQTPTSGAMPSATLARNSREPGQYPEQPSSSATFSSSPSKVCAGCESASRAAKNRATWSPETTAHAPEEPEQERQADAADCLVAQDRALHDSRWKTSAPSPRNELRLRNPAEPRSIRDSAQRAQALPAGHWEARRPRER